MYRYVDALLVRCAVSRSDSQALWPDLTGDGAGSASWRPWLTQARSVPEFAAALEQASPVLAGRVAAVCTDVAAPDREVRRVVVSVMRYLLRASGRATPYGLFAGVAPARLAARGQARLGTAHRAVARVRAEWLTALVDWLEADPGIRPLLTVRVNDLLVERDGQFELPHRASKTPGGSPIHVRVRVTGPVRAAVSHARDPIQLHELADKLACDFGVGADTAGALLAQMVVQRLLVTNLRPPMTVTDPLSWIAAELKAVSADADSATEVKDGRAQTKQILDALHTISGRVARHDASTTWTTAAAQRRQLTEAPTTTGPSTGPPVAVDLRMVSTLAVPQNVAAEAARAAGLLIRLARPDTGGWPAWHGRFLERYGPHAVVPVMDAVDPDVGLGYPAGYQGAPPAPTPGLTDRDRKLQAMAQRAALWRQREIVLDDARIGELAGESLPASIQPSTELTVRVDAPTMPAVERGEFRLEVVGASRRAGTITGRFLDLLDPKDRQRFTAEYTTLPAATDGALVAQVSAPTPYTISDDVARAPQVMPHLIPVGEYHDSRAGDQIPLQDLAVTADAHRLCLVSVSRRRVVEPVLLSAVEPVRCMLPLVRFLIELPTALATSCTEFDWGAAASLPFLPALRHGRTILSPARWLLTAAELPGAGATWPEWSRSLTAWLNTAACPTSVDLGAGDQRIRLDLTEPAHRALLRDHLTRAGMATLRAAPPADAAGWIGGHAHEVVIPLAASGDPPQPPQLPDNLDPVLAREHGHLPGRDGRVYIKLYGHPDRQSTILTGHLPSLLSQLSPGDRWWFLRYDDPEPHLRLRLTGDVEVAMVGAWGQRLRRAGLIARVQLDTDYPETARFGGRAALAAAEQVFAADSATALAQLAALDHKRAPHRQALTAASLVDLAVGLVGDPGEAMRWLIGHTCTHRPGPSRAVYDQAIHLANPYDHAGLAALPSGERILQSWHRRRRALTAYRDTLRTAGTASATRLLPDLLHLHHTRMVGPDLEGERACLHLARAAALSWTTRAGRRP